MHGSRICAPPPNPPLSPLMAESWRETYHIDGKQILSRVLQLLTATSGRTLWDKRGAEEPVPQFPPVPDQFPNIEGGVVDLKTDKESPRLLVCPRVARLTRRSPRATLRHERRNIMHRANDLGLVYPPVGGGVGFVQRNRPSPSAEGFSLWRFVRRLLALVA